MGARDRRHHLRSMWAVGSMKCLQLEIDESLTKKCRQADRKITALQTNVLIDKDLSIESNIWISDVYIVVKKRVGSQTTKRWWLPRSGADQANPDGHEKAQITGSTGEALA